MRRDAVSGDRREGSRNRGRPVPARSCRPGAARRLPIIGADGEREPRGPEGSRRAFPPARSDRFRRARGPHLDDGARGRDAPRLDDAPGVSRPPGRDEPRARSGLHEDGALHRPCARRLDGVPRRRPRLRAARNADRDDVRMGLCALRLAARVPSFLRRHQARRARPHRASPCRPRSHRGEEQIPPGARPRRSCCHFFRP